MFQKSLNDLKEWLQENGNTRHKYFCANQLRFLQTALKKSIIPSGNPVSVCTFFVTVKMTSINTLETDTKHMHNRSDSK